MDNFLGGILFAQLQNITLTKPRITYISSFDLPDNNLFILDISYNIDKLVIYRSKQMRRIQAIRIPQCRPVKDVAVKSFTKTQDYLA